MVPEEALEGAEEIGRRERDFGDDSPERLRRIAGDVVGVEERQSAGCVEVVEKRRLRFLDGFGPVFPWDFGEGFWGGGCSGEEEERDFSGGAVEYDGGSCGGAAE